MNRDQLNSAATDAAKFVRSQFETPVRFGIILGTGAGVVADSIEVDAIIPYSEIPNFPVSTALSHKSQLVCGSLAGHTIVGMQGRFHLYEGYSVENATLPVRVMHRLGIDTLFISNASGGLNPKMDSGDIMLISSHIDLMFRCCPAAVTETCLSRPVVRGDHYDTPMMETAKQHARENDFALHTGVYAALIGPNYETRAEYRMLRTIGADAAGMSTVPEVNVAAQLGMRVLGMSVITNVANPDLPSPTSAQEVVEAAERAATHLKSIVVNGMQSIASS